MQQLHYNELLCVLVLYLRLPPGVPDAGQDAARQRRLGELQQPAEQGEGQGRVQLQGVRLLGHTGQGAWGSRLNIKVLHYRWYQPTILLLQTSSNSTKLNTELLRPCHSSSSTSSARTTI